MVQCCNYFFLKKAEHQGIDAFELWWWRRLLRVPWTARRPGNTKVNQPQIFIGRIDDEAEAPVLWPPHVKNWLIGKDSDAQKDWRQKENGTTEDETVAWHHRLSGHGHEFEQALGDGEGQGSLAGWSSWGHKESDTMRDWTTTELNSQVASLKILIAVWLLSWTGLYVKPNTDIEARTPDMTVLGERAFRKVVKVKQVSKGQALIW